MTSHELARKLLEKEDCLVLSRHDYSEPHTTKRVVPVWEDGHLGYYSNGPQLIVDEIEAIVL
jgi:hypothetical protein